MRGHRTIKGQRGAKRAMINEQHSPLPSDPPAGAAIFELRGPAEAAAQTALSNSALTNTEKERKLRGQSVFYSSQVYLLSAGGASRFPTEDKGCFV